MKNSTDKDQKSMESAWRRKMQEEISHIPEGLWEKMSARLDAEEKPKVFFIKTWPWAAMLAVALGLAWYASDTTHEADGNVISGLKNLPTTTKRAARQEIAHVRPLARGKSRLNSSLKNKRMSERALVKSTPVETIPRAEAMQVKEEVAIKQNTVLPTHVAMEKIPEKEEVIWVQVDIDPLLQVKEDMPNMAEKMAPKKRNLGQLLKKIKQVIKGNPGEWSEIKENFHLVANKYVQTEENIKQKFQIQ